MKTNNNNNTILNNLSVNEMNNLTKIVNETVDSMSTNKSTFSSADLWNIQRNYRSGFSARRRNIFA